MKTIKLRGFCYVNGDENGKMIAREQCSCGGCFDNTYDVEEGDEVVSFRSMGVNGKLKNITLISMRFRTGKDAQLSGVFMKSHDKAIEWYCGGQLYDNYGVDGGKSFVAGLMKSMPDVNTSIDLPQAAKNTL
jgi:hypothetical protein